MKRDYLVCLLTHRQDIKDRYYTICRRLVRTRTATDPQAQQSLLQAYSFDKREVLLPRI